MEVMASLTTNKGEIILVDDEDFYKVNKYTWFINAQGYPQSRLPRKESLDRTQKQVKLHRLLLDLTDPLIQVDHKNMNKLDNRRSNLRVCTNSENQANIKVHKRNKTGYKGVRYQSNRYEAYIWKNKPIYLGRFDTVEEAALAYNKKALELFGEFARLNDI